MPIRTLVDWTFSGARRVSNPDGSLAVDLPADTSIVDGPGAFQGQILPKAVIVGFSGPIVAPIAALPVGTTHVEFQRFHGRIVFQSKTNHRPGSSAPDKSILHSNLPFDFLLRSTSDSMKVAAFTVTSVRRDYTETYPVPGIFANDWHSADIIYDLDTLFLLLDGKAVSCHGFGRTAHIEAHDVPSPTLVIGGTELWNRFSGAIAHIKVELGIPGNLLALTNAARNTPQWFITTKLETLRPTFDLGNSIIDLQPEGSSWVQYYQYGALFFHYGIEQSAFEMHGQILEAWKTHHTTEDFGYLRSDEVSTNVLDVRASNFSNGTIYLSPIHPVAGISGQIWRDWSNEGLKVWGFPLTWRSDIPNGFVQPMENGSWYYKTGAQHAYGIKSATFLHAYNNTGGVYKWGFPISSQIQVEGLWNDPIPGSPTFPRIVYRQEFENGTFFWSQKTGAHAVAGDIRKAWLEQGGILNTLGLPNAEEMDNPDRRKPGSRLQGFEKGVIIAYKNPASVLLVKPFQIYLSYILTKGNDGGGQNDIYFTISISEYGRQIYQETHGYGHPSEAPFQDKNMLTWNAKFPPVLIPKPPSTNNIEGSPSQFTVTFDVKDDDDWPRGNDDDLGVVSGNVGIDNAWGQEPHLRGFLTQNRDHIKEMLWSAQPQG
ncbi:hypothetical protein K505DRAFT_336397 [Melanomma pulvis-pyrius CBS 109.77]|uniref:Uncharacterized protein n=1 Tax=Melanomma pulvis-pyrius CBS 109.77 TaxID=1314802 RepID=A0A6A6XG84_9PLEO|nr:hypothetical protein K505DRAFT_336397 [Melanomma pulvis-pyrius CBS 109.77]